MKSDWCLLIIFAFEKDESFGNQCDVLKKSLHSYKRSCYSIYSFKEKYLQKHYFYTNNITFIQTIFFVYPWPPNLLLMCSSILILF